MSEQIVIFIALIVLLHFFVVLLSLSIKDRAFKFWGGKSFGKEAPYICTILTVVAVALMYAVFLFTMATPIGNKYFASFRLIYLFSALGAGTVLVGALAVEAKRRFVELGAKGVFVRLLASAAVTFLFSYVMLRIGLRGTFGGVEIASVFGLSFVLTIQTG